MLNEKLDLVLLAGGKGRRIAKFTKITPKPLIKIGNKAFIQYLLNYFSKYNFNKIYILAGYKGYKIKNKYNKKNSNLIPIKCFVEKKPLGTGGALNQIKNEIRNNFILINSDSFLDINLKDFLKTRISKESVGKMAIIKNQNYKSNLKLSNLSLKKNKIGYAGKFMNSGIYYFKKDIFKFINYSRFSLEEDLLPKLINEKKIEGQIINGYFIDIGTYKNLRLAKKKIPIFFKRPACFLDRDGVINVDFGYVHKIKNFIFKKNVLKALKFLNKKKINIFIVTNQSGIAKGYYSENYFINFQRKIKNLLERKNIIINDIEYCPFHEYGIVKKYKKKSLFRKPGNLMIVKLQKKWCVDIQKSFMIGDQKKDMLAAKKSNIKFYYAEKDLFILVKKICKNMKI